MVVLLLGLITNDAQTQGQFARAVQRENSMEGDTGQKCNCSGTVGNAYCIISYHALIPETTQCVVISYPICRFIVLLKP